MFARVVIFVAMVGLCSAFGLPPIPIPPIPASGTTNGTTNGTNKVECGPAKSQENCTALGTACKWMSYGTQFYCVPANVNPSGSSNSTSPQPPRSDAPKTDVPSTDRPDNRTDRPEPPRTDRPDNRTDRPEPPRTDRPDNRTDRPKVECGQAKSQDNCTALGTACKWVAGFLTTGQAICVPADFNPSTGIPQPPKTDRPDNRTDRPEPPRTDRPDNRTDRPQPPRTDRPDNRTDRPEPPRTDRPDNRTDRPEPPRTDRPEPPRTDRPDNRTDRPTNRTDAPNKVECGPAKTQADCAKLGSACKWFSPLGSSQSMCVPADSQPGRTDPPRTPKPTLPSCSVSANCSNHGLYSFFNVSKNGCQCGCKNFWTGNDCSVCPSGYSGDDCNKCPAGTIRPNCRKCSLDQDCSGHGKSVDVNSDSTQCLCQCRNQWKGRNCNECDTKKFGGMDCDRCAAGLINYPACTGPQAVNITQRQNECRSKCVTAGCTNSSLAKVLGDYSCQCSNCTIIQKPVCGLAGNGTVKKACAYPLYKCQVMEGANKCAVMDTDGKNRWVPCVAC